MQRQPHGMFEGPRRSGDLHARRPCAWRTSDPTAARRSRRRRSPPPRRPATTAVAMRLVGLGRMFDQGGFKRLVGQHVIDRQLGGRRRNKRQERRNGDRRQGKRRRPGDGRRASRQNSTKQREERPRTRASVRGWRLRPAAALPLRRFSRNWRRYCGETKSASLMSHEMPTSKHGDRDVPLYSRHADQRLPILQAGNSRGPIWPARAAGWYVERMAISRRNRGANPMADERQLVLRQRRTNRSGR